MTEEKGLRYNLGKLNLDYCPLSTQIAVASVFAANSELHGGKYPDNNWRKCMEWSIPLNCIKRHLEAFSSGEDFDHESGLPHLWHAQANLAMLIEFLVIHPSGDDRLHKLNLKVAGFQDMLPLFNQALQKNLERKKK
jgi:hypothetical protein